MLFLCRQDMQLRQVKFILLFFMNYLIESLDSEDDCQFIRYSQLRWFFNQLSVSYLSTFWSL